MDEGMDFEAGKSRSLQAADERVDVSSYRNFVRMDAVTFEELLLISVAPRITYRDTLGKLYHQERG